MIEHLFVVQGTLGNAIAAGTNWIALQKHCVGELHGGTRVTISRCLNNQTFARNCANVYTGKVEDMPAEPPQYGEKA